MRQNRRERGKSIKIRSGVRCCCKAVVVQQAATMPSVPKTAGGVQGCHPNIVMPIEALATGQGEVMCPGVMPFSTRNRNLVNLKMFL